MNIKLIALDLDGTTLRTDNTLSPVVKKALEAAAASGVEVVAASGRPFGSMPREIREIKGINYYISSNGAAVYNSRGERIFSQLMDSAEVEKLMRLTEEYDFIWEAFAHGETYTDRRYYDNPLDYGCSLAYIDYVRSSRGVKDDMRGYILKNSGRLDSVEFICTERKLRESVRKKLERELKGMYITSSSANYVEFMHRDATKSNAMKKICELGKINLNETCACGNADNDVDMISAAGVSAAVANASESCLKAAEVIVPSNDDDGVARLIEKILGGEV